LLSNHVEQGGCEDNYVSPEDDEDDDDFVAQADDAVDGTTYVNSYSNGEKQTYITQENARLFDSFTMAAFLSSSV